jgi:hypothetical protein
MEHRRRRNRLAPPELTVQTILEWADKHFHRTGRWPSRESGQVVDAGSWPTTSSGPVENVPGEAWHTINHALKRGIRGLPGGSSLLRLLATHRGHRNASNLPSLSVQQILTWADKYYRRTGSWPTPNSGPIKGSRGDSWRAVNYALKHGTRGLPGGLMLSQFLVQHRRKRLARND